MVEIEDEEFGLSGPFWISDVAMSGGANDKTSTMLTLHRPEHQLYGDEVLPVRTKGRGKR